MSPNPNPLSALQEAKKNVPVIKYAIGIVGLAAAVTIIGYFTPTPGLAMLGIAGLLVAMVALFLFERATKLRSKSLKIPILVMLWVVTAVITFTLAVLFSSIFFDKPSLGLQQTLFSKKVESRLKTESSSRLVESLRQLPPKGIELLISLGSGPRAVIGSGGREGVYWFPNDATYNTLKQMGSLGLLKWRVPPAEFDALVGRLNLRRGEAIAEDGVELISGQPLSAQDEQQLSNQTYELSEDGKTIYKAIITVVKDQIK